jgi:hypothetical protein
MSPKQSGYQIRSMGLYLLLAAVKMDPITCYLGYSIGEQLIEFLSHISCILGTS